MSEPHWERGYRCHGYWLGEQRVGVVGISHGKGAAQKYGYSWRMDYWHHNTPERCVPTLRAAKRAVEKAYEDWQMTDPQRLANLEQMSDHELLVASHTAIRLWKRMRKDRAFADDMIACNAECCRRGKGALMDEANRLSLMSEEEAKVELERTPRK